MSRLLDVASRFEKRVDEESFHRDGAHEPGPQGRNLVAVLKCGDQKSHHEHATNRDVPPRVLHGVAERSSEAHAPSITDMENKRWAHNDRVFARELAEPPDGRSASAQLLFSDDVWRWMVR